jgi:heterodisulfide reductase subunit A2
MSEKNVCGIYFYYLGNGNSEGVDIRELRIYAERLPGVGIVWDSREYPLMDSARFLADIRKNNIQKMILAGNSPGFVKSFFTKVMLSAGNKAEDVLLVSFSEYNILKKEDTSRAKSLILCAVHNVPFELVALPGEVHVHPDTLVIGGGIAGIQAALELADAGNKVFLLEKSGTIGGHMAMFDKTFPTLDCAACILTPKMVEVGQHVNIELMTCSEVKSVSGQAGNFMVKILKKARYVSLSTCIGCGTCSTKCPVKVPSEFDAGTTMRKAIFIPFPQAVPNKYMIDPVNCTYIQDQKCGVCAKVCPVEGCINYEDKDEEIEIQVGNIIVATGFRLFDARRDDRFGYGKFPSVLTSLEFERLVNAGGPTGGEIRQPVVDKKGNRVFTLDGKEPHRLALIHCIGSRDVNFNKYCSRVCCMYSLKLAHLVREKLPEAEVYEYFIDMRAFGKGYEEFYRRIQHEGVHIIRGRTAKVEEKNGYLLLRTEDIMNDNLIEQEVDMVILAAGLEAREDARDLGKMLGISTGEEGWFLEANSNTDPVNTYSGGISIAGVCQGPKDIPDTVAQASAAAARVIQSIITGKTRKSLSDVSIESIELNIGQYQ